MPRAFPWLGLVAGLSLIAAALLGVAVAEQPAAGDPDLAQPDEVTGDRLAEPEQVAGDRLGGRAPSRLDHLALVPGAREQPRPAAAAPRVPTRSARLADLEERAVPVMVESDGAGLLAPVDPVGLGADGVMGLPGPDHAGWFRHGAVPGEASGTTVIAGHVDSHDGPGAFLPLREVVPGDVITVTGSDGDTTEYEVTDVARYRKGELPTTALFTASGAHRLALITCGGQFDEAARAYTENLVVIAEPTR